jgi:hypothetical protein
MGLRSGDGPPDSDALGVDHGPQSESASEALFRALGQSTGSCLTRRLRAVEERLRQRAHRRRPGSAAAPRGVRRAQGGLEPAKRARLAPSLIDPGAHPRTPLTVTAPAASGPGGESPARYARRAREVERTVR